MFRVIILICSTLQPVVECHPDTAKTVIQGPAAANEIMCGLQSQAYFAALGLELGPDEYLKIRCVRTTIGKENVG